MIYSRTQTGDDGATTCQRVYPGEDVAHFWDPVFHIQMVLLGLLIPGLVLVASYSAIISKLTRTHLGNPERKRGAVRTMVVLVLCFVSCWFPYGAGVSAGALMHLGLLPKRCALGSILAVWLSVTEPMAYVHCCLSPLLYAFLGSDFRCATRRALRRTRAFRRGPRITPLV